MANRFLAFTGSTLFGLIVLGAIAWSIMNEKDNDINALQEQNNQLQYQHCLDLNRELHQFDVDCTHFLKGK